MEQKLFSKLDEGFTCRHCGREVPPLGYTSRDHCPFCLWSIHIDINPGDRANDCLGDLEPICTIPDPKKEFIIEYKCKKCGQTHRNKAATRGTEPDNRKLLIKMTAMGG